MYRLFEKAMFWELRNLGCNPMALVEIPGASRRQRKPIIVTVDQYFAVFEQLPEPYGTMVVVSQCLGLRVSEILALQWKDVHFDQSTMQVKRARYNKHDSAPIMLQAHGDPSEPISFRNIWLRKLNCSATPARSDSASPKELLLR